MTYTPKTHHIDRRAVDILEESRAVDDDELLKTGAVADWLGVSYQFLSIGRHRGYGPRFVKVSDAGGVRYRRGDVRAWLRERTYTKTDQYLTPSHNRKGGRPKKRAPQQGSDADA